MTLSRWADPYDYDLRVWGFKAGLKSWGLLKCTIKMYRSTWTLVLGVPPASADESNHGLCLHA